MDINNRVTEREAELLNYLKAALPEADRIMLSDDQLLAVVRHAEAVRGEVPWGLQIPEGIYRAFVVFPRVNNEDPVFYHGPLWEQLRPRILGRSLYDAVLEVNYWACEMASYQATDPRTANPLTVITRAFGRCGEESVLLVSALRSAGIPARQVYVPRWAHCDSNHAWVEAWVEGTWRYLGACEPEPVLDSGWFTAAASKAMLVHTRAYGLEPEGDRIENRIGNAAVINRTAGYAETVLFKVHVTEDGKPKEGLTVRFEIVNGSEFSAINEQTTDADGRVDLLTGRGTLRVHVTDGIRYTAQTAELTMTDALEIDFGKAEAFVRTVERYAQHPPAETRIKPTDFPEAVAEKHKARLAECNRLRTDREATFSVQDPYHTYARGNGAQLDAFLADPRYAMEDKKALLDTLREKDFVDFRTETLTDALDAALPSKDRYPLDVWQKGVLAPRIAIEMLAPVRAWFRAHIQTQPDARAVWKLLTEELADCEMDPPTLIPDLRAVWTAKKASPLVRDVMFVAVCRAFGLAARLNPATREKEYYEGTWKALAPGRQADARLVLVNRTGKELAFYANFTVARLENGVFHPLMLFGLRVGERTEIPVLSGCYRVTTSTRQTDGSVDGYLIPAEVPAGGCAEVELLMAEDRTGEIRAERELPALKTESKVLPEAGSPSIIAQIDPGAEPSEHFLNELLEAGEALEKAGLKVFLLVGDEGQTANAKLRQVLQQIPAAELLLAPDPKDLLAWRRILKAGELRLPFAVAVDGEGRGLLAFVNYNVGSVRTLMRVLQAAKNG